MNPSAATDPYRLERFVFAQADTFSQALAELRAGEKRSHWMWYVFPQVAGLGSSTMAQKYAIQSRAEAVCYLAHPLLSRRLIDCTEALLGLQGRSVEQIMGRPDNLKLQSSMTLFAEVCGEDSAFTRVLRKYYAGTKDPQTIQFLKLQPPSAPLLFRTARWEDVPALEKLIGDAARGLLADYYNAAQIAGALGTIFGVDSQLIRDGTYHVAEHEKQLVGCGGWSRRKTLFGSDRAKTEDDPALDPRSDPARIRAFFVDPSWARRGIGRKLMQISEQAALAAGFREIEIVATLAGEPLYRTFGYHVVQRYSVPLANGEVLPVVRLSRKFPASNV